MYSEMKPEDIEKLNLLNPESQRSTERAPNVQSPSRVIKSGSPEHKKLLEMQKQASN